MVDNGVVDRGDASKIFMEEWNDLYAIGCPRSCQKSSDNDSSHKHSNEVCVGNSLQLDVKLRRVKCT